MALLSTLVLIFAFQAENILTTWTVVLLPAVPILQVYFNSGLTYGLMWLFKVPHNIATSGSLIGASNFFELAAAVAITPFGPTSPVPRNRSGSIGKSTSDAFGLSYLRSLTSFDGHESLGTGTRQM